jgi:hypothetical protein
METTQKLERSLIILADRISYEITANDALKFTQAALNLMVGVKK